MAALQTGFLGASGGRVTPLAASKTQRMIGLTPLILWQNAW
jgi:hypothetical protein